MRRVKQAIDLFLIGVRRVVFQERIEFLQRRRQADQVEAQPPQKGRLVGLRSVREAFAFKPRENKHIDRVATPRRVGDPRGLGTDRRHERPMGLILRALFDPGFQFGDLFGGKRFFRFRRRHALHGIVGGHAPEYFAVVGLAGDDRAFAGLGFGACAVLSIEAEFRFAAIGVGTVTFEAMFGQDRPNFAKKIDFRRVLGIGGDRLRNRQDGSDRPNKLHEFMMKWSRRHS